MSQPSPNATSADTFCAAPGATRPSTEAPTIDVWDYFAENIDEFAVAKALCDHFDANPKDLHATEVDAMGLYLRAKVTIKREQVAYAIAQRAVDGAQQSSRSAPQVGRSVFTWTQRLSAAFVAHPEMLVLAGFVVLALWMR